VRLAELLGTLSIAADAGLSMPDSHALRSAIVTARFGELLGCDPNTVRDAYYLSLLAMSGCSAESQVATNAVGDEVALGAALYGLDWGRTTEVLPAMLRVVRRGKRSFDGLVATARALGMLGRMTDVTRGHCEVAIHLAERFGFDEAFRGALFQVFERWDGTGLPDGITGEQLALSMRIAHVAIDANVGHRLGGVEGAVTFIRKHARHGLDPTLVERFCGVAEHACSGLLAASPWSEALAAEPLPHRSVEGDAVEEALRAIAHFADIKCRFTRTHSTGVAELAAAAARHFGLDKAAATALHRAALVHDVGRVAVSAGIWDKADPLTDEERERIRLHTYAGERVLARSPALREVADIATLAHERLDGSGYHRRLPSSAIAPAARILAAADVYHALREDRPHRRAMDGERAASELIHLAETRSLCIEAVRAVLSACGHVASQAAPLPYGLTSRELEVLRLLARGLTNKEIASTLGISTKTAGHHVQHVLEKLGVRTRAAATMIAMQHGLVVSSA
jgi:HD-GYP domain-containing protein (c-di-GMP phosphodiesterase class II)